MGAPPRAAPADDTVSPDWSTHWSRGRRCLLTVCRAVRKAANGSPTHPKLKPGGQRAHCQPLPPTTAPATLGDSKGLSCQEMVAA